MEPEAGKNFHPPNPTLVHLLHIYSILPKVLNVFHAHGSTWNNDWRTILTNGKCGCTDLIKHWIICGIHTTSLDWIGIIAALYRTSSQLQPSLFPGCLGVQKDNISYLCFPGWLVIFPQFAYSFDLSSCCHLQNSATVQHFKSLQKLLTINLTNYAYIYIYRSQDFHNIFCLCCIVMSRRSVTH